MYNAVTYKIDHKSELLNYDEIHKLAKEHKPKILIGGYSAYPRKLDLVKYKEIANDVGAKLLIDMAHFAGLAAAGVLENPVPYCDVVTSTTHKTLRGPRGGIILCKEEFAKKVNSKVFPGIQGGPLEHVIAAKAVAFGENLKPSFKIYAQQIVKNSKALAEQLMKLGYRLVTNGTDNHLLLMDLTDKNLTGKLAEKSLDLAGITVNKNTVPNETKSPFVTSGIRLGTPALTTRGMKEQHMTQIAKWIDQVLKAPEDTQCLSKVRSEVKGFCQDFPLFQN